MRSFLWEKIIVASLEAIAAFGTVAVLLRMPIRDPNLPNHKICAPFAAPTSQLRSPEDNMTLWQFMTISWMAPLISLGSARQLNGDNVWSLSFEFQHKYLHERFRELKGSVLRRLLKANAIDLVILSFLEVLESLAGIF